LCNYYTSLLDLIPSPLGVYYVQVKVQVQSHNKQRLRQPSPYQRIIIVPSTKMNPSPNSRT
jgi:hypothetical protein